MKSTFTMYFKIALLSGALLATHFSNAQNCTGPLAAGTYSINRLQPASATNFTSVANAVNALATCGISGPIVFNVAQNSGPYNERVVIPQINSATAANTITFNGNGETVSYGTNDMTELATVKLDGAHHIVFNNFVVKATGSTGNAGGFGILLTNNADSNFITNCTIDLGLTVTTNFAGILINAVPFKADSAAINSTCNGNHIEGNTTNGGSYSCSVLGRATATSKHNTIINNNFLNASSRGIYMAGAEHLLLEGNNIERPTRTAVSGAYDAIEISTNNSACKISKNKIHNLVISTATSVGTISGIYTSGCKATAGNENEVSNNLIYDIKGNSTITGIYHTGSEYINYYHNTIVLDDATSNVSGTKTTRGLYLTNAKNAAFVNNSITAARGGTAAQHCIYIGTMSTAQMNSFTCDYNDYNFGAAAASGCGIGYYSSSTATTIIGWRITLSKDAHSVDLDPQFQNMASGDLTPSNLAMDNTATPLSSVTTDILNTARSPITPDIGAYEFGTIPFCADPSGLGANDSVVYWDKKTGILLYEYAIDQSATAPQVGAIITDTFKRTNNLVQGATYYLHLRVKCATNSFSGWVTYMFVNPCRNPLAAITPNGALSLCDGDSILLSANNGAGLSYQWRVNDSSITGAIQKTYKLHAAGDYDVIVATSIYCADTSVKINITRSGAIPHPVIVSNSGTLSTGTFTGYQWYYNGTPISGATSASYVPTKNGNYTVSVLDSACSGMSSPYVVQGLGITEMHGENEISIYPNPVQTSFTVKAPVAVNLSLYSVEGKILLQQKSVTQVDMHPFAAGIYLLRVEDLKGNVLKYIRISKTQP